MHIDKENNSIFLIQKLNNIKQTLNSDPINLNNLKKEFEFFEKFKQEENFDYLEDLLDPIKRKGVKIPSKMPVATCSFQLKSNVQVSTNRAGLALFYLNPFFIYDESLKGKPLEYYSSSGVKSLRYFDSLTTAGALSIISPYDGDSPVNDTPRIRRLEIGQCLPSCYSSYRLVSACVEAKCTESLSDMRGVMGGAIVLQDLNQIAGLIRSTSGSTTVIEFDLNEFIEINRLRKSPYSIETSCLEGVRMLYFPLDDRFMEFKRMMTSYGCTARVRRIGASSYAFLKGKQEHFQSGFNFFIYLYRCRADAKILDITTYLNFECIPNPEFLNYFPITINVFKTPKWKISELAKTMEKHAVTALKKMSGIDFFVA